MFTGIVEETGEVVGVDVGAGGRRLRIAADEVAADLHHGQSVAVSGVCLTVEDGGSVADLDVESDAGDAWFEVFLAEETLDVTYLDAIEVGHRVNLERALPADGRLDGHLVQGHVDTTTEVVEVERVGDDWRFTFAVPAGYGKYVAAKGSIALDGVSLTVAEVDAAGSPDPEDSGDGAGRRPETFAVAVVPTTYELTNFGEKSPGDPVHVEIDVLARYAERLLADPERATVPLREDDAATGAGSS